MDVEWRSNEGQMMVTLGRPNITCLAMRFAIVILSKPNMGFLSFYFEMHL